MIMIGTMIIMVCTYEDCTTPTEVRSWCRKHYNLLYKTGKLTKLHSRVRRDEKCSILDCKKSRDIGSWCSRHYHQQLYVDTKKRQRRSQRSRKWKDARNAERPWLRAAVRFGVTEQFLADLFEQQSGLCAICQRECVTGKRLAVDHCHQTGVIRGLLCARCNTVLGHLKDDPILLGRMRDYILSNSTSQT